MKLPVVLLALAGVLMTALPVEAQETAGRVILAAGNVTIVRAGQRIPAAIGIPLRAGDTIEVSAQSHAQLHLTDDSIISLRPDTTFRITEYAFEGKSEAEQRSFFNLLKGGMRTVTGLIRSRQNYRVTTETVSIGIRGTHYWLVTCNQDCRNKDGSLAENGDYGLVREGNVELSPATGAAPATSAPVFGSDQVFQVARGTGVATELIGPPPFMFTQIGGFQSPAFPVKPDTAQAKVAPKIDPKAIAASFGTILAPTGQRGEIAGDTRNTSTVSNNTNFTFQNVTQQSQTVAPASASAPVLQVNSAFSTLGPTAVIEPTFSGTVFYRLTGPFNIPVTCSTPPCAAVVAGDITLAVNFALGRATANGNLRTADGEILNVGVPNPTSGIPITINGNQVTFNGTFLVSNFPNNRGSFDCSQCGPATPQKPLGTPGFVNETSFSGIISGSQATLTIGVADSGGSGSATATLTQQNPASNSAAAMAIPRLAVNNPNPNNTVGTDTFGAAFFNVTVDASGRVTQLGRTVGGEAASVGGATNAIVGSDATAGNLVWGTWTNGTTAATKATITDGNYNTFQPANNSVQVWISGDATNTLPPSLGVLSYSPVGSVFTSANQRLNSANLTADFVNRSLTLSINATNTGVNNTFQMTGKTGINPTTSRFAGGGANESGPLSGLSITCSNPSGTCAGAVPGQLPTGSYNGFFAGSQAQGAGVAFSMGFGVGTGVTGAVGLKR